MLRTGTIIWQKGWGRSTGVSGLYDDVTVRKTGLDTHSATLGMVTTPSITVIDVFTNDDVIAIMHHNLRRNRTGAHKRCPDGRA
jgi:hypothetical protein